MPNWLIHLGLPYIAAKLLRIKNVRLVLLGAIIPDIARLGVLIRKFTYIGQVNTYSYLEPFHSPFMFLLIALTISLLSKQSKKAMQLLVFGGATHFFLDALEKNFGFMKFLFYPFILKTFSFQLFWPESSISILLMAISTIALLYAIIDKKKISYGFKAKNLKIVLPLIIFTLLLPLATQAWVKGNLPYITQFKENKGALAFSYSDVISTNPSIVKELDFTYEVITDIPLREGDVISMQADLKDNKVYPTRVHIHKDILKFEASILALFIFAFIWFTSKKK